MCIELFSLSDNKTDNVEIVVNVKCIITLKEQLTYYTHSSPLDFLPCLRGSRITFIEQKQTFSKTRACKQTHAYL